MAGVEAGVAVGKFEVHTTVNRGHSLDWHVDRLTSKLIAVSDNAPPVIRDQAHAFKHDIALQVRLQIQAAMASERTTIIAKLRLAGMEEAARLIQEN